MKQGTLGQFPRTAIANDQSLGGLKQQKSVLSNLDDRSLKSRCQKGHEPSEGSRGKSQINNPSLPLPFFWQMPAILGIPWLATALLSSLSPLLHGVLPSVYLHLYMSFLQHILDQVRTNPIGPYLSFIIPVKTLFLNKVTGCCFCGLVALSCLTLCDPMDCSPLGSSVHGIYQARILEWVAISFSRGSS